MRYSYDGSLLTNVACSGAMPGVVSFVYNNDFRVTSMAVNGVTLANYEYDDDGLLVLAGDLEIERQADSGLPAMAYLGDVGSDWEFNEFGDMIECGAFRISTWSTLFEDDSLHDKLGRITNMWELVLEEETVYNYGYDSVGRLVSVAGIGDAGGFTNQYFYDANGNRTTSVHSVSSVVNYSYDSQDRLLASTNSGGQFIAYLYDANGSLTNKTVDGTNVTSYSYDGFGNPLFVSLPNGRHIEYVMDAGGHRVGKKVDGALARGWIYNGLKPVTELDASSNVVSTFVYGMGLTPAYMVKTGVTYRIVSDRLGSVRLVINAETCEIAQRLDYDEWGNVLQDTNPGFQPFSFAGGLYDADTKVVRFGARDYDPETGRWTTKDSLLLAGGDANVYVYCGDDPLNLHDPTGMLYDRLSGGAASGYGRGGVSGSLQAWSACIGSALLDVIGGRVIEATFSRSGHAAGKDSIGAAWAWGIGGSVYGVFNAFALGRLGQGVGPLAREFADRQTYNLYELGARPYPNAVFQPLSNLGNAERGAALIAEFQTEAAVKAVSASTPLMTRAAIYATTTPTPAAYLGGQLPGYLGVNAGGAAYIDWVEGL